MKLDERLQQASRGGKSDIEGFLESFLETVLYVPERHQAQPMSDSPVYPDEFLNILGVQQEDRAFVPVFTDEELVEDWLGQELSVRKLSGHELLQLMPDEWWISLNPGSEYGKEFSPWEVRELRLGRDGIEEVVDELLQAEENVVLQLNQPNHEDYGDLIESLKDFAERKNDILRLYLLREERKNQECEKRKTLLVGVESKIASPSDLSNLQDTVRAIAAKALIGSDEDVRVYVDRDPEESMALSLFRNAAPFYERKKTKSFLSRLSPFS